MSPEVFGLVEGVADEVGDFDGDGVGVAEEEGLGVATGVEEGTGEVAGTCAVPFLSRKTELPPDTLWVNDMVSLYGILITVLFCLLL